MKIIKGISVSPGFSTGKAYFVDEDVIKIIKRKTKDKDKEIKKFNEALEKSKEQIKIIRDKTEKKFGKDKAEIFESHLEILNDPEFVDKTIEDINENELTASYLFKKRSTKIKKMFEAINDKYIRERAVDVHDVSMRVLKNLEGIEIKDLSLINREVIIFAEDLTPSETTQLNPKFVKGFVTKLGGETSHSAIMSRTLGIPAIVGVGNDIKIIKENDDILLNASEGLVISNPTKHELDSLQEKQEIYQKIKDEEETFKNKESLSKDGWKTKISINIGNIDNLEPYDEVGAEGIGLFRTEFLYMSSDDWPTEEEQFSAYKKVLQAAKGEIVVIRTLDIGGDKTLKYFKFPQETNPFLGYRAIRMMLHMKDIFKTQLRALLRASAYGNLAINLPFISTIDEVWQAKDLIEEIKLELKNKGIKIGKYQIGIMVEVPSVVISIDKFIKYVDFFSIGTNDLIQYTFAADRMSKEVSYLYQPLNPTTLRMIDKTIKASHEAGKWTAICGELAREPRLTPLFVAMGLDEFSMSAPSVLKIRRLLSKINKSETEKLLEEVLDSETQIEVDMKIKEYFANHKITY